VVTFLLLKAGNGVVASCWKLVYIVVCQSISQCVGLRMGNRGLGFAKSEGEVVHSDQ